MDRTAELRRRFEAWWAGENHDPHESKVRAWLAFLAGALAGAGMLGEEVKDVFDLPRADRPHVLPFPTHDLGGEG